MKTITGENNWLSLSDYSAKFGLSVSTLRRRIKASQIQYKMIDGKYFLPSHDFTEDKVSSSVPKKQKSFRNEQVSPDQGTAQDENTFQTAKVLLDELKKAYMQSLQDKEKQIIQLKQQIADLKTLVMYLEGENARINNSSRSN